LILGTWKKYFLEGDEQDIIELQDLLKEQRLIICDDVLNLIARCSIQK